MVGETFSAFVERLGLYFSGYGMIRELRGERFMGTSASGIVKMALGLLGLSRNSCVSRPMREIAAGT